MTSPIPGTAARTAGQLVLDRLRWWDLAAARVLEQALFPDDGWTPEQFWSELARVPESRYYVAARRDGALVGYAGLFLAGPDADVQTVAVAAGEQGRGTGRQLVEALARQARQRGARVLRLEVRADNEPARGLYDRLGFVVDGRRRDYYGPGRGAVLMSRDLRPPVASDGSSRAEGGSDG